MLNITKKIKEAFRDDNLKATATIKGVVFGFGPTSNRDEFALAGELSQQAIDPSDAVAAIGNIRLRTIASMLKAVDGVEIPEIVNIPAEGDVPAHTKERVLYLLGEITEWPASLVTSLHLVCIDLKKKIRKDIRESVKYEWFGENLIEKDERDEQEEEEALLAEEEKMRQEEERRVEYTDDGSTSQDTPSFQTPEPPTPTEPVA